MTEKWQHHCIVIVTEFSNLEKGINTSFPFFTEFYYKEVHIEKWLSSQKINSVT